jgi:protein-S-isoprenylcysteine O-methyltransferase Ste14
MDGPSGAPRESNTRVFVRGVVRVAVLIGLCAWGGLSGWWQLWPFLALVLVVLTVNLTTIAVRNPALLRERLKPDRPEKGWDRIVMASWAVFALAIFAVAGLDVLRYRWSIVSPVAMVAGGVLFLAGDALVAWCMGENPFLERTVRVQRERSHRVIATGPYRFVRHPMYGGVIVMSLGWPLLLGSWWAMVPTLFMDAVIVARTCLEDHALHDELEGYRDYASRTPRRLLPGIW